MAISCGNVIVNTITDIYGVQSDFRLSAVEECKSRILQDVDGFNKMLDMEIEDGSSVNVDTVPDPLSMVDNYHMRSPSPSPSQPTGYNVSVGPLCASVAPDNSSVNIDAIPDPQSDSQHHMRSTTPFPSQPLSRNASIEPPPQRAFIVLTDPPTASLLPPLTEANCSAIRELVDICQTGPSQLASVPGSPPSDSNPNNCDEAQVPTSTPSTHEDAPVFTNSVELGHALLPSLAPGCITGTSASNPPSSALEAVLRPITVASAFDPSPNPAVDVSARHRRQGQWEGANVPSLPTIPAKRPNDSTVIPEKPAPFKRSRKQRQPSLSSAPSTPLTTSSHQSDGS
jgi:hypothetical protein